MKNLKVKIVHKWVGVISSEIQREQEPNSMISTEDSMNQSVRYLLKITQIKQFGTY